MAHFQSMESSIPHKQFHCRPPLS